MARTTATNQAAKKGTSKKTTGKVAIPAEAILVGLQKLNIVCGYVQREIADKQTQYHEGQLAKQREEFGRIQAQQAPSAPPQGPSPSAGVEQMAHETRCLAQEVQKQAEAIRSHLTNGGNVPVDTANGGSTPTRGPIKDAIDATQNLLFSIRHDLDVIAQYTIGQ